MGKPIAAVSHHEWWPCACTKHRKGVLTHIRQHHPSVASCPKCKAKRPEKDWPGWAEGRKLAALERASAPDER